MLANMQNMGSSNEDIECVLCKAPVVPKKEWTAKTIVIASVCGTVFVGTVGFTLSFIAPAFRRVCLPYLPATEKQLSNLRAALSGRRGTLLDIGSGDGRIVIEGSKLGLKSYGVELNYWLVLYSRFSAWRHGRGGTARFYRKDLWKTNLAEYNNIVIFGVDTMMQQLETKFDAEITPDCRVFACRFPLPKWTPVRIIGTGIDTVWVYQHPDSLTDLASDSVCDAKSESDGTRQRTSKAFGIFENDS